MGHQYPKATPQSLIALCVDLRTSPTPEAETRARHLRSLAMSDEMAPAWRSLERRDIPADWYAKEAAYIASSAPDWWGKSASVRKKRTQGIIQKLHALRDAMRKLPPDWYGDAANIPQVPGPVNFIALEGLLELYGDKPSGDDDRRNGISDVRWTAVKLTELLIREAKQPLRAVVARTINAIFRTDYTEADIRRLAATR